jgi:argininosuccinate lyase
LGFIEVKSGILQDDKYRYLFSVEAVNEKVKQGLPFREAYRQVGEAIDAGTFGFDFSRPLHHTHEGSIGNLCTEDIRLEMRKVLER